ncbi:MAG: zinc metallopeptidase [Bacillota bacterium]|nr:zinc metallopeptidase [Bacillota bacterium]NLV70245.1 zinc metallopeptidase [Clostridiales bacterium]HPF18653.1 zinc metallopeptidase [Bacillota bacterium]
MGYYTSMIVLIPAILFAMYAQGKVSSAYRRYANVRNTTGMTGAQVARMILDTNGLSDVPIQRIPGNLTDNYNPLQRTMNLSDAVYSTPSVASISIAAHEAGHAIQHSTAYAPLKFRNAIVPVVNIGSMAAWPLLFIGLIIGPGMGDVLFNLGVVLFMGVVIFHLVTLPVELDASKRAIAQLVAVGAVSTQEESVAAQKVLSAAALTYIAALAMAVANLLRIFLMRRN